MSSTAPKPGVKGSTSELPAVTDELVWNWVGIRVQPAKHFKNNRYRGGLEILAVRSDSAADQQGIRAGDILVGLHRWETSGQKNLIYILEHVLRKFQSENEALLKFYLLRDGSTLFGQLTLHSVWKTDEARQAQQSNSPLMSSDPEFTEHWDLTLREVIEIAVANSKTTRSLSLVPFGYSGSDYGNLDFFVKDATRATAALIAVPNFVNEVEDAYWKLWTSFRNLETAKRGRDDAQITWQPTYEKSQ